MMDATDDGVRSVERRYAISIQEKGWGVRSSQRDWANNSPVNFSTMGPCQKRIPCLAHGAGYTLCRPPGGRRR